MLREIRNAALVRGGRGRRWRLALGDTVLERPAWSTPAIRALGRAQLLEPVAIARDGRRCTWLFEDRFYAADDGLQACDVVALVRERERRARTRLERAHARLAQEDGEPASRRRRERIPRETRRAVFERDGGRCVECDASFDLQYDHVIPLSLGGASTVANLQLLCADCNQRKGDSLG
ncbi:MAG TPA: HNH endonuclease [Solirubrobacteraceae bacterium]|jgi:HNH endonuclease